VILIAAVLACSLATGTPAISEPEQEEEFCNKLKVSGTGIVDIGISVVDRRIGLEYYNLMYGNGYFEMDSMNDVSTHAASIDGMVNGSSTPLNLYETTRMAYSGTTPLVGAKYLHSDAFWGGIGAEVQETFAVTEMEKTQTAYFASTDPATHITDPIEAAKLREASPVHLTAMDTKTSFNGTWQTDASWHKIFYKDIQVHQSFTGEFDVEKLLKFHEDPGTDALLNPWP